MDVKTIRFYDKYLNFLGEEDDLTAVIYVSKWNTYGTFEIYCDRRMPYMQKDNYIIWNYDSRKNGIIKYVQCTDDGIVLKGYSLLWMLTNRITLPPKGEDYDVLSGAAEDVMCALVEHNAANPADAERKIPMLICRESLHRGGSYKYQTRHANLMECEMEISKETLLGMEVDMDLKKKQLIFQVLEGTDRTIQQKERPYVLFSEDRDNIESREYVLNDSDSKNCAYVAGQGEGAARTVIKVGDEYTGLDRKEVFIDARDIEDAAELPERGRTKLAGMKPAESYNADVDASGYQKKWYLGDFVTVLDEEYVVSLMEQILEVEEDFDATGYSLTPTFGIPEKTIKEAISGGGTGSSGGNSGGDITYIHTQMTAAKVWVINHNLGKFPSVTVVDSAGSVAVGETEYLDKDNIRLSFSGAFAGHAYLN